MIKTIFFFLNFFQIISNIVSLSMPPSSSSLHCNPKQIPEEGYEILHPSNCTVYLADNRQNIISRQDYTLWKPSNLWMKNPGGIRYLTFRDSCFYGSPGVSNISAHKIVASESWNQVDWIYLANGCVGEYGLGGCFPEPCSFLFPKNGSLKWNEISKCHYL